MKLRPLAFAITSILATSSVYAEESSDQLDPIMVNADFRPAEIQESTSSVTVIDSLEMQKRSAKHLEDVLLLAPNVNVAGGASRSNFIQIRGIGERGQFSTPLTPSVGLMVDGIDYSRTGAAGTLFDMKQVEVLRGPQGTRFGANALGGMVIMQSNEPTKETQIHYEHTLGNFNTQSSGVAVGGTLVEDTLLGRISIHKHQSDGYMKNSFLDRKDTNNQDELNATGQLRWLANEDLTFDLAVKRFDFKNGYDAFNLSNDFTTTSDQPGKDTLKSNAFSLKSTWDMNPKVRMETTLTHSKSDLEYSFDEDWTNTDDHPSVQTFDKRLRERNNQSFDMRFLSSEEGRIFNKTTDWVAGVYHFEQDESSLRERKKLSKPLKVESGKYKSSNTALYGQLDHHLNPKTTITTGLRAEQFKLDYKSSLNEKNDEILYGGKVGISHQISNAHLGFASISRGYKAGGVNDDPSLTKKDRVFDTEFLWNLETGLNSSFLNNRLKTRLTAFYALRKDQQVNSSTQEENSGDFTIYLANAAKGKNYGLESEVDWSVNSKFRIQSSLGLLSATFNDYTYRDPYDLTEVNLNGRKQAHAPSYQYSIGGEYSFTSNWILSANLEGRDSFYFSNSHNAKSSAYNLVNSSLEYLKGDWTVTLWARNLMDKAYETRGFYFGIDPSKGYADNLYTHKAEPRTVGLTVSWDY